MRPAGVEVVEGRHRGVEHHEILGGLALLIGEALQPTGAALVASDIDKWTKVVAAANIERI